MLRLHTSSTGLDPAALVPGRDLVAALDLLHGTDAPPGTALLDHLDAAGRACADAAAVAAHDAWRAAVSPAATVEGIDWPFMWMLPVHSIVNGAVARALALREALRSAGAGVLELADTDPATARLARAVAGSLGVQVRAAAGARDLAPPPAPAPRSRRKALPDALLRAGAPSHLRPGSVAFHAYWPLTPLLDHMLAAPGRRPAVFLDKRPTGGRRTLTAMRRGGWIGRPTPLDRRRARPGAARIVAAVRAHGSFVADGLEIGPWIHPRLVALAEARATEDLAQAAMLRRAFRGRRASWVVGCYDVAPEARLLVRLAREAGVRTLLLSHGAFLLPQPFGDLDTSDEVALWTRAVAPAMRNWDRPIHDIGYPLPHAEPPPARPAPALRPTIAVLGQLPVPTTCVLDERVSMAAYETALRAVAARVPDARVVLRPHPAQDGAATAAVLRRFPALEVREDRGGDIVRFFEGVDLCIGSASTATLQAPLAGTSVVALNLTGTDWPPPVGGDTAVFVARSQADLEAALDAWRAAGTLPGREDLLGALGATGADPVARLLAVLDGEVSRGAGAAAPSRRAHAAG